VCLRGGRHTRWVAARRLGRSCAAAGQHLPAVQLESVRAFGRAHGAAWVARGGVVSHGRPVCEAACPRARSWRACARLWRARAAGAGRRPRRSCACASRTTCTRTHSSKPRSMRCCCVRTAPHRTSRARASRPARPWSRRGPRLQCQGNLIPALHPSQRRCRAACGLDLEQGLRLVVVRDEQQRHALPPSAARVSLGRAQGSQETARS